MRTSWVPLVGLLCVALVLMSGMVQAAHFHPAGQPDHECTLCIAAHHVAVTSPLITLNLSVLMLAVTAPSRRRRGPLKAIFFRLAIRPPPADLTFSA